jgi:hypothetical protein
MNIGSNIRNLIGLNIKEKIIYNYDYTLSSKCISRYEYNSSDSVFAYNYDRIIRFIVNDATPELLRDFSRLNFLNNEEIRLYGESLIQYLIIPHDYRSKTISILVEEILLNLIDGDLIQKDTGSINYIRDKSMFFDKELCNSYIDFFMIYYTYYHSWLPINCISPLKYYSYYAINSPIYDFSFQWDNKSPILDLLRAKEELNSIIYSGNTDSNVIVSSFDDVN